MWQKYNPNPQGNRVGDCVIRAISKITNQTWEKTYCELVIYGLMMCDMPSANHVWGKYLKDKGYWITTTDMDGQNYSDISYLESTCIIIGNEGHGVSSLVKKSSDFVASIPMVGKINSLNASVAAGIMIYEVVRQRNKNGI